MGTRFTTACPCPKTGPSPTDRGNVKEPKMETIPTWQVYAGVALIGAILGLGPGCVLEALDDWMQKPRLLNAALGGALFAPACYFLSWDFWSLFHLIGFVAAALIGGLIGWVHGPKKTAEELRKESVERHREALRRDGLLDDCSAPL